MMQIVILALSHYDTQSTFFFDAEIVSILDCSQCAVHGSVIMQFRLHPTRPRARTLQRPSRAP